jgi:hypothetical protein
MRSAALEWKVERRWPLFAMLFAAVGSLAAAGDAAAQATAAAANLDDPRVGLSAGWHDAGEAASSMELLAHRPRPEGFFNPANPGDGNYANTDLAFQGDYVFIGNYNGFQVWNVSNPKDPSLRVSVICPGGQGDISVHGNLLFMSVEETRGRVDCGTQPLRAQVDPERFRGVRIFDISNLDQPVQVAAVQTCRGSHTHTLVPDPRDPNDLYVYVSGTSIARPAAELPGCADVRNPADPNTSYWSIAVIHVPLDAPRNARVIAEPRVFADPATGAIAGLWGGGDHGPGTQSSAQTNQCHDITAYPALGLAAGACSGNGILFDISDPANPVRLDEVTDPNFAYWHSATFSNDGRTVLFTDEWGGGGAPRCLATDREEWGANAIFEIVDGRLRFASYYKLPAPQTVTENCVAHNGSLVPVPGRDIKVQAWYQGGISVFDFSDPANPFEIAFFDRGPISANQLMLGGYWSAYWHNGAIYGSEIARGLDVFRLEPSEHLSQNEIDAARLVRFDEFNPQTQLLLAWPAEFVVARAYLDQLRRNGGLPAARLDQIAAELDRAEATGDAAQRRAALDALATRLEGEAAVAGDGARVREMAGVVREIGR